MGAAPHSSPFSIYESSISKRSSDTP